MWTRLTDDCWNYDLGNPRSHILLTNITGQRYTARITIMETHGGTEVTYSFDIDVSARDWSSAKEETLRNAHTILCAHKSELEKHITSTRTDILSPSQERLASEINRLDKR